MKDKIIKMFLFILPLTWAISVILSATLGSEMLFTFVIFGPIIVGLCAYLGWLLIKFYEDFTR